MKLLTKLSKAALLLLACTLVSCSEPDTKNDERTPAAPTEPETPTPPQDEDKEGTKYSIEITAKPTKTTYKVGETFDANGLTINYITKVTTNGKTNAEKSAKISVKYGESGLTAETDRELTEPGEVTLTVNVAYEKATTTFTLEVAVEENKPTLFGIVIENNTLTIRDTETLKNFKLLEGEKCPDELKVHIEIENNGETRPVVNLVDVSKLATNFPNAKINASNNIEYTINGGTGINKDLSSPNYDYIEDEFKDLTQFEIDGKIKIVKSIDASREIKTITVGAGSKLNITGKYIDIGLNRFVNNADNDGITLPLDVEITTDGRSITSDIAIDQYKQLGLTTPKFDLTISDENAYNFAKNILENYSYDQLNSVDSDNVKENKLSISKYVDGKKALYTGGSLNADVPSLKYDTLDFINANEVKNLKITGTPSVSSENVANYTNVVFTGDMSSITNIYLVGEDDKLSDHFKGVVEFLDNPMKKVFTEDALIRVNKVNKNVETIWANILDLRGLSEDADLDEIASNVKLNGASGSIQGYFRNTTQKDILKESLRGKTLDGSGYLNHFGTAYSEDVESERALMRTLQEIADEASAAL